MPSLIGLDYSPWTRQVRWALDHHGIPYRFVNYVPMLGEPWLRWTLRRWRGGVSVPAFVDDSVRVMDSYAIALYADQRSPGTPPLFPTHLRDAVTDWNLAIETLMRAGRALVVAAVAASPQAVRASTPAVIPGPLRAVSAPLTALGLRFLRRKYDATPDASLPDVIQGVLQRASDALRDGRPFLLGNTMTFADVNLWAALDFLRPGPSSLLDPALIPYWTRAASVAAFPDLFAWRDRIDGLRPIASPAA
jgi:glutathione S-transferase